MDQPPPPPTKRSVDFEPLYCACLVSCSKTFNLPARIFPDTKQQLRPLHQQHRLCLPQLFYPLVIRTSLPPPACIQAMFRCSVWFLCGTAKASEFRWIAHTCNRSSFRATTGFPNRMSFSSRQSSGRAFTNINDVPFFSTVEWCRKRRRPCRGQCFTI